MDWLLNHPQVLFAVAIAVVAILQKLKQARPRETAGEAPAPGMRRRRSARAASRRKSAAGSWSGAALCQPHRPHLIPAKRLRSFRSLRRCLKRCARSWSTPPLQAMDAAAAPGYSRELERQQQMLARLRELETARPAYAGIAPATVDSARCRTGEPAAGGFANSGRPAPGRRVARDPRPAGRDALAVSRNKTVGRFPTQYPFGLE